MQLWIECPDCKGASGHYAFHGKSSSWKQMWVPCEPCEGKGRVPLARSSGLTLEGLERSLGPIDEIEEECTRG